MLIQVSELDDTINYFNVYQTVTYIYASLNNLGASVVTTKNQSPLTYTIGLNFDKPLYTRNAYTILQWIGDTGGFQGFVFLVGTALMSPFQDLALRIFLVLSIFKGESKWQLTFCKVLECRKN